MSNAHFVFIVISKASLSIFRHLHFNIQNDNNVFEMYVMCKNPNTNTF